MRVARARFGHPVLVLTVASTLMSAFVFWDFVTLKKAFLFDDVGADGLSFVYPSLYHFLRTGGLASPEWSFHMGTGTQAYTWYTLIHGPDPLNLVLHLVPPALLAHAMIFSLVAKLVVATLSMYALLRGHRLERSAAQVGAILYAFSGALIALTSWVWVWASYFALLPLLLLVLEPLARSGRWLHLPFVFLVYGSTVTSLFSLYQTGLFLGLYLAFRYLDTAERPRLGLLGTRLAALTAAFALGIGMLSFLLAPQLQTLLFGHARGDIGSYGLWPLELVSSTELLTSFFRLFSNDISGTARLGYDPRFFGNYFEAPFWYCGVLTPLLLPFALTALRGRRRWVFALLLAILATYALVPNMRHLANGLSAATYRTSTIYVTLLLVVVTSRTLSALLREEGPTPRRLLGVTITCLFALCLATWWISRANPARIPALPLLCALFFVMAQGALLVGLTRRPQWQGALLLAVCLEMSLASWFTINYSRQPVDLAGTHHAFVDGRALAAVERIQSVDRGIYRVRKTSAHPQLNDPMLYGYLGTTLYYSFLPSSYTEFLRVLDAKYFPPNWIPGLGERYLLDSFLGVKYYVQMRSEPTPPYATKIQSMGVEAFRNQLALPILFTSDSYMTLEEFQGLSNGQKDRLLMTSCVLDLEAEAASRLVGIRRLGIRDARGVDDDDVLAAAERRQKGSPFITRFDHESLEAEVHLDRPSVLILTTPFDEGWEIRSGDDILETFAVDVGFLGCLLPAGDHVIRYEYRTPWLAEGIALSLACVVGYLVILAAARTRRHRRVRIHSDARVGP